MLKLRKSLFFFWFFLVSTHPFIFAQSSEESITFTTYYPAPYGSYNELQTNKLAVGYSTSAGLPNINGDISLFPHSGNPASWAAGKQGEIAYASTDGYLYVYNNSSFGWVKQGGGGWYVPSSVIITTATHNGNFGGYDALYTWIQSKDCSGYHVCDQTELSRYAQLHGASSIPNGFYQVGMGSSASGGNISDCSGWTSAGVNNATSWQGTNGYLDSCSNSEPVLCCR